MSARPLTVLVVGATGSIGRYVVEAALREGYGVRALVRNPARSIALPEQAEQVVGDLTHPQTLAAAVDGVEVPIARMMQETDQSLERRVASPQLSGVQAEEVIEEDRWLGRPGAVERRTVGDDLPNDLVRVPVRFRQMPHRGYGDESALGPAE